MTEPAVDVARPEAAPVPVVEPRAAQGQVASGQELGSGADLAIRQAPGPGHQLVRGSGWIVRLDGVIEERLVGIVDEGLVVPGADAPGELVVVVGRETDQGQDFAGLRVHDDHHAPLESHLGHRPLQCLLGVFLLLGVDGQGQRVAGAGLADRLQHLRPPTGRIALDSLATICPAQLGFIGGLHAGLADQIVREIAPGLEIGQLLGRDRSGVAQDLGHQWTISVLAAGLDSDLHAGKLERGLRDQPRRALLDVARDAHEVEVRARIRVDRGLDVGYIHVEQGGQPFHDLQPLRLRKIRRPQLDNERRDVGDEDPTSSVVDQAARRRDRLHDGAILG